MHEIGSETTFGGSTWCGLDGNAPVAGTDLPGYPLFKKEKNIAGKPSARSSV